MSEKLKEIEDLLSPLFDSADGWKLVNIRNMYYEYTYTNNISLILDSAYKILSYKGIRLSFNLTIKFMENIHQGIKNKAKEAEYERALISLKESLTASKT